MNSEENKQTNEQANSTANPSTANQSAEQKVPVENVNDALRDTAAKLEEGLGSAAETVREQANKVVDAFNKGEYIQNATVDPSADADDKLVAMLCYVSQIFIPVIMPLIVLLSESSKKRPFQRYHAVQSLGLVLAFGAIAFFLSIGTLIIQIIPLIGWLIGLLMLCLMPIGFFMGIIALFYYGYQAYQGKRFAIPALTSFMRDQKWL